MDENVAEIRELCDDCQLARRMIAHELDTSKDTVRKILVQDLGMRKQQSSCCEAAWRHSKAISLCAWTLQNNFKKIIFWIMSSLVMKYGITSVIPRPNAGLLSGDRRISPGQINHRCQESKIKTMLICFLDIGGISHFEFVPAGSTVNRTFYMEMLKRLIDSLKCKRGELWRDQSLILHHNLLVHSSLQVSQFLAGKGISAMDHPLYSPDLAPADFWLHAEREMFLRC
jgi:hypothetical protein